MPWRAPVAVTSRMGCDHGEAIALAQSPSSMRQHRRRVRLATRPTPEPRFQPADIPLSSPARLVGRVVRRVALAATPNARKC